MTPITIYDIAKEANVSVATVSRVLNDTAPVRASTREKIMSIIEKHQFQPNAQARSLIKKETGTIAIILPDITNPFFPEVFWGAENEARGLGYTFFLCNTAGITTGSPSICPFCGRSGWTALFSSGKNQHAALSGRHGSGIDRHGQTYADCIGQWQYTQRRFPPGLHG